MKIWIKVFLAILVFGIAVNVFDRLRESYNKEIRSPDHKPGVLEGLTGKTAVDQYLAIQEKSDTFNLPALKTAFMMFFAQQGRYPANLEELERSGDVNSDLTRDQYGNRYVMKMTQNVLILSSAGKDKIRGTTDDIEHHLKL
ncbi:MAG: hypothetical protein C4527_20380 [Candidatus Omnitrophota bacterium]|jgi:hypothetical protein|nr:MAG: hypothetical protein C4527_20380 [Candidatus Omnitrophota bacterium]